MDEAILPQLSQTWQSVDEVELKLHTIEQYFIAKGDKRAVFASSYLVITKSIHHKIKAKYFINNDWVYKYQLAFANLYRGALFNFICGAFEKLPDSWRICFESAVNNKAIVLQDLLLGVNAHINHDLSLALYSTGIDPVRDLKYKDHTSINLVLEEATNQLQDTVSKLYAPLLIAADRLFKNFDEEVSGFSIKAARENSWHCGLMLANAANETERSGFNKVIDRQASLLAKLILYPSERSRKLFGMIKITEDRMAQKDLLLKILRKHIPNGNVEVKKVVSWLDRIKKIFK